MNIKKNMGDSPYEHSFGESPDLLNYGEFPVSTIYYVGPLIYLGQYFLGPIEV